MINKSCLISHINSWLIQFIFPKNDMLHTMTSINCSYLHFLLFRFLSGRWKISTNPLAKFVTNYSSVKNIEILKILANVSWINGDHKLQIAFSKSKFLKYFPNKKKMLLQLFHKSYIPKVLEINKATMKTTTITWLAKVAVINIYRISLTRSNACNADKTTSFSLICYLWSCGFVILTPTLN